MKRFPHQAALLKRARAKMGLSQWDFGAVIGLPHTQMTSDVERGIKPLTISRWRLLDKVVGKSAILDACVADFVEDFERKYEGAL